MKIAQVVCVYPPYRGGIGKVAEDNLEILKNRGHEVTVFTTDVKTSFKNRDVGVKYLRPLLKFGNAAILPKLFFELPKFEVVFLHYPFFGSAEIVYLLKKIFKNKFKLIIYYHMDTLNLSLVKKIFSFPSTLIRNWLFEEADLVISSSLDYIESSQIASVYKNNPKKFVEIPFSVDTDKFFPAKFKKIDYLVITFVGGMDKAHYFKGVDLLLDAFSRIDYPNLILRLIGSGELVPIYQKKARELKIDEKVEFLTEIDNNALVGKYQESDIVVLPSINRHESFGIVLLEAMSSGVPVIASALPGVRKVFNDGKEGLLFEPGNEKELQERLEYLLVNKYNREEMSTNARNLALRKYDKNILEKKFGDTINLMLTK